MATRPLSLKARALRYLAAREHSRAELERKLAPHVEDPAELARVLDELTAKGFISAERVVESVIYRRAARLGTARVVAELRAKGLPADLVAAAAERLRASELERAQAVWAAKFGHAATDPRERARQMRFLASRGFAGDVVRRVLRLADEGGMG